VSKKIITEADIESVSRDGVVEVLRGMIVTPLAREHASRKGIRLVYGGGTVPSSEDIPRDPESGRKGPSNAEMIEQVTDEVVRALSDQLLPRNDVIPSYSPLAEGDAVEALTAANDAESARAVVVATGMNKPGVAAALTASISDCGADIMDISQTIVSDFFSMILVVNLDTDTCQLTFREFKSRVEESGRGVGAEVGIFHEAILRAMHRV